MSKANLSAPKISVCIPAYNRAERVKPLLDLILEQSYDDFDLVICEDNSPEREAIRKIVQGASDEHPGRMHYFENETNLGYDGNVRNLIAKATGDYCLL